MASSVLSPGLVKACHNNGKIVGVWISSDQVEDTSYYQWLEDVNVDLVIANHPKLTPSYIENNPSSSGFTIFLTFLFIIAFISLGYWYYKKQKKELSPFAKEEGEEELLIKLQRGRAEA